MKAILATFALLCTCLHSIASAAERPGILLIFTDDLGYGDLGCYGSPTIRTAHLDRMASEGLRFSEFYYASEVCRPSRAALLTERYPIRSGMCGNHRVLFPNSKGGLPPGEITIVEALLQAGYATAHVGKWHLGIHEGSRLLDQGFQRSFGLPYSNDMDARANCPKGKSLAGIYGDAVEGQDVGRWNLSLRERSALRSFRTKEDNKGST